MQKMNLAQLIGLHLEITIKLQNSELLIVSQKLIHLDGEQQLRLIQQMTLTAILSLLANVKIQLKLVALHSLHSRLQDQAVFSII